MSEYADPRATFGEALVEVGEAEKRVLAVSADSSSGSGLSPFRKRFPERHLEFGIMEQGVIGYASGLATTGWIPVVAAIAPFVTARPFEMFRNDLGYMNQNVKVVGRCGGMTYYDLGSTHHSLEDFAIISTIPGVTILSPGDPVEIRKATQAMIEHRGPVYMRIGNQKMPVLFDGDYRFELGKGVQMRDGRDVSIVATGTVLSKAAAAADLLEKDGIHVRLINIHTIKPIDREIIVRAARETGKIVTVEEHYKRGGLGSMVSEVVTSEHPVPVERIGIDDLYVGNGPYEELIAEHGLQPEQIARTVRGFLDRA